jgi:hypothetical protein
MVVQWVMKMMGIMTVMMKTIQMKIRIKKPNQIDWVLLPLHLHIQHLEYHLTFCYWLFWRTLLVHFSTNSCPRFNFSVDSVILSKSFSEYADFNKSKSVTNKSLSSFDNFHQTL